MGDLKKFWDSKHVDTYNKYLIFPIYSDEITSLGVWSMGAFYNTQ